MMEIGSLLTLSSMRISVLGCDGRAELPGLAPGPIKRSALRACDTRYHPGREASRRLTARDHVIPRWGYGYDHRPFYGRRLGLGSGIC